MRALVKDPADRFPTVTDFIAALHSEANDTPAAAPALGRLIAVLPFVNASPEPDTEYLSDGITDELINALAKVSGLRVASRTSVFALDRKGQDIRAIGALLGAAWILEGTVRRADHRLRITTQLTSTDSGRVLWSERFDRTFDDVFAIQEEIAHTIVETLRTKSFAEIAPPANPRRTPSITAYGAYLKGRYEWNKRTQYGVNRAIRYFEQAIAEDPDYAQAYAGLSDSYALEIDYRNVDVAEGFALAEEYARKALALDDTVAESHASLAWSLFIYDWDWEASRREFRRAIELDPQYATARHWYAFWLAAHARHGEAIVEGRIAADLDPSSLSIRRSIGWFNYYARRFEESSEELERAIAMNPTADESYRVLALCQSMLGRWTEAEQSAREAMLLSAEGPYNRATLAYVLARSGQPDAAHRELAELEARARIGYVSPVSFATVHLGLENWDAALDWMERAHHERRGWLAYLRVNPIMDGLRGRARFESLVRQMKL
jgi:serine/threonine-protein kinase